VSVASSVVPAEPRISRTAADAYLWGLSAVWIPFLAWQVAIHRGSLFRDVPELIVWTTVLALLNLFPVPSGRATTMAPDLPVAAAGALILHPAAMGLVAFFGALNPRDFQGQMPFRKALFNRSQVSLTDFAASLIGHALIGEQLASPVVFPFAYLILAIIMTTNVVIIVPAISLDRHLSLSKALELHPGTPVDEVLTFFAWGGLAAMLVALYDDVGTWALLVSFGPTLLGRQMLARSRTFIEAARAYRSAEQALLEMSNRIREERHDERRLIAADLHDEVLPPLFKVSLMAEVLKGDLATGRLLEADEDLPELLSASEVASRTLRELIGELRRSSLGTGGLRPALAKLLSSVRNQSAASLHEHVDPVEVNGAEELVLYQVAKEAFANAITHAHARNIWVTLSQDRNGVRLSIRDDGDGFDPSSAREGHYGIYIMRERAASIGAQFFLDSSPGRGCHLSLHLGISGRV
jgi:signal transduction histidine kinase